MNVYLLTQDIESDNQVIHDVLAVYANENTARQEARKLSKEFEKKIDDWTEEEEDKCELESYDVVKMEVIEE